MIWGSSDHIHHSLYILDPVFRVLILDTFFFKTFHSKGQVSSSRSTGEAYVRAFRPGQVHTFAMTWLAGYFGSWNSFQMEKLDWGKNIQRFCWKTNDCQVWVLCYYQTYLTVRPANEREGATMFMACADVAIIQQKMLMKPPILMNVSIMHPRVQLNFQEVTMIMIKNHDDRIYQDSIPGWFSSNEDFLLPPIDAIIQDFRSYRYVRYTWFGYSSSCFLFTI